MRICLIFEYSISHSTRLRQEIRGLQDAGASVQLLTSHTARDVLPEGVHRTISPLEPVLLASSKVRLEPFRTLDRAARKVARPIINSVRSRSQKNVRARKAALLRLAGDVDLFWVIDFLSLPSAIEIKEQTGTKVLYETLDLVPEYQYRGTAWSDSSIDTERRLIGKVDGFVTACGSYADYYEERYGDTTLQRRPFVRDNMPSGAVASIRPTAQPLRLVFLGSLMFDRPWEMLLDAMTLVTADVRLVLQGRNDLGDAPAERIAALGIGSRVSLADPCPPEDIVATAAQFDVGIVPLRGDNVNERCASTAKLFTYIAAGLAVLGSNLPGIAAVVRAHENGCLVDGTAARDWADAIDAMASLPDSRLDAMKERSVTAAAGYSWEVQRDGFVAEFQRALRATPVIPGRTAGQEI